jgi:hypothetical protein
MSIDKMYFYLMRNSIELVVLLYKVHKIVH